MNMNLSYLVSPCISFLVAPGRQNSSHEFWNWVGNCGKCGIVKKDLKGIFCANFATPRSGWAPCKGVWCGACYTKPAHDLFYHAKPQDESGFHWTRPRDLSRHEHARDGDHLLVAFQCDLCVFRNLTSRNPGPRDQFLLECIRQASLDAFWGRETATVASTRRAVFQTIQALRQVQVPPPFPPLGPFPVEDTMGYVIAIAMLIKSREPGRYATYQQFESIRKLRAGFSNVYMSLLVGTTSLRTVGGGQSKTVFEQLPYPLPVV
jgi:hypothetical protein